MANQTPEDIINKIEQSENYKLRDSETYKKLVVYPAMQEYAHEYWQELSLKETNESFLKSQIKEKQEIIEEQFKQIERLKGKIKETWEAGVIRGIDQEKSAGKLPNWEQWSQENIK